jgi:hypothetical protein
LARRIDGKEAPVNKKIAAVAVLVLLAGVLPAEDIRVIVPYLGAATNVYQDSTYGIDLNDTKLMEGLFFQWVNTDLFQANAFVYHSADINYSQLWGGHLIGDFYVWSNSLGKAAVGAGLEVISLDMDAGDNIPPLADFKLPTTLYVPYARVGHYFYFGDPNGVRVSLFPWAGLEYDVTRGTLSFDPPGPGTVDESIDDETLYEIVGISVGATLWHFIELQAKYKLTLNATDRLNTFDAMANVFFTRNWGLSYRYKYMESTSGSTSYHIFGVAYAF